MLNRGRKAKEDGKELINISQTLREYKVYRSRFAVRPVVVCTSGNKKVNPV
jgi:hypothetical protein